jgi:hypothetical protein
LIERTANELVVRSINRRLQGFRYCRNECYNIPREILASNILVCKESVCKQP